MRMLLRVMSVLVLVVVPNLALAQCPTVEIHEGVQQSGAEYRIYMPDRECWNGNLVLFAHGYMAPIRPIEIPEEHLILPDGTNVPEMVNGMGFAFSVTSFSVNGLAVPEALKDLKELVKIFRRTVGKPNRVYLNGVSQGGLITALALEGHPDIYDAGVATCGPIGDFQSQINYFGDFRVVFDYFFPGVIPGDAMNIPEEVIQNWWESYVLAIVEAIQSNPLATLQLLNVTNAAVGPVPETVVETVLGVLWYNVFGTNDATDKLGGIPFDNSDRVYEGSDDDVLLNEEVQRFTAAKKALKAIERQYQTTGKIQGPLVTQHTVLDPIVPYWHEPLFLEKTVREGTDSLHANLPIPRYGHCNVTADDVLLAFGTMLLMDAGQGLPLEVQSILPAAQRR